MGDAQPAVDVDFQVVQSAVLRECVVNLARVKEYIAQNVGGTLDAAGFDNWQDLMRGIQAGLLMLGKTRAVQCMERITGHLKGVMRQGGSGLPRRRSTALADAIVSVEYYMDTLQAGRSDPWYMLDNADAALSAVDAQPWPDGADGFTRGPRPGARGGVRGHGRHRSRRCACRCRPLRPCSWRRAVACPALAEAADPELIALFMEEAREEQARIARHLPEWDEDPSQEESLISAAARLPHLERQWPVWAPRSWPSSPGPSKTC